MNYTKYLQTGGELGMPTSKYNLTNKDVDSLIGKILNGDKEAAAIFVDSAVNDPENAWVQEAINGAMIAAEQGDQSAQLFLGVITPMLAEKGINLQLPPLMEKAGGNIPSGKAKLNGKYGCPCMLKKVGGKLIEVNTCDGKPVSKAKNGMKFPKFENPAGSIQLKNRFTVSNDRGALTGYGIDDLGYIYFFDRNGVSARPLETTQSLYLHYKSNPLFRAWLHEQTLADLYKVSPLRLKYLSERGSTEGAPDFLKGETWTSEALIYNPSVSKEGLLLTELAEKDLRKDLDTTKENKVSPIINEKDDSTRGPKQGDRNIYGLVYDATKQLYTGQTYGQRNAAAAGMKNEDGTGWNVQKRNEWINGAGKDYLASLGLTDTFKNYTGTAALNRALFNAYKGFADYLAKNDAQKYQQEQSATRRVDALGNLKQGWQGISDNDLMTWDKSKGSIFDLSNDELARMRDLQRGAATPILNGTIRNGDEIYTNGTWRDLSDTTGSTGKALPWQTRALYLTVQTPSYLQTLSLRLPLRLKNGGIISYAQYLRK